MLKSTEIQRNIKLYLVLVVSCLSILIFISNLIGIAGRDDIKDSKEKIRFWSYFPSVTMGLDLKGGSQLLLEVGLDQFNEKTYEGIARELKSEFLTHRIPFGKVQSGINGVEVRKGRFAGLDSEKISNVAREVSNDLMVEEGDESVIIRFSKEYETTLRSKVMEQVVKVVRRRVDAIGTKEIALQRIGRDKVLLQMPGIEDPERLKILLGEVAELSFHLLDQDEPMSTEKFQYVDSDSIVMSHYRNQQIFYKVKKYSHLGGGELLDARPIVDDMKISVMFKLNKLGSKKLSELTEANIGRPLAIVLDQEVLTAPVINSIIANGTGIITGSFSMQEASDLANLLRSGSLPASVKVVEERIVGPSLGEKSVGAAKVAGIIGIGAVALFMIIYYKVLGVVASVAIILNLTTAISVMAMFGITLTLPGIAALILTLGMSVDSNVLIYERMRDEIRSGNSDPRSITQNGFRGAWSGILDSNVTTLFASMTMVTFGSGFIRGFAISLIVGIMCSLFSAIMFSKLAIEYLLVDYRIKIGLK